MNQTICPKCKEEIRTDAEVCKHCKFDILAAKKKEDKLKHSANCIAEFKKELTEKRKAMTIALMFLLSPFLIYLFIGYLVVPIISDHEEEDRVVAYGFSGIIQEDTTPHIAINNVWTGWRHIHAARDSFFLDPSSIKPWLSIPKIAETFNYQTYNLHKFIIKDDNPFKAFIDSLVEFDSKQPLYFFSKKRDSLLIKSRLSWMAGNDEANDLFFQAVIEINNDKAKYYNMLNDKFKFRSRYKDFQKAYRVKYCNNSTDEEFALKWDTLASYFEPFYHWKSRMFPMVYHTLHYNVMPYEPANKSVLLTCLIDYVVLSILFGIYYLLGQYWFACRYTHRLELKLPFLYGFLSLLSMSLVMNSEHSVSGLILNNCFLFPIPQYVLPLLAYVAANLIVFCNNLRNVRWLPYSILNLIIIVSWSSLPNTLFQIGDIYSDNFREVLGGWFIIVSFFAIMSALSVIVNNKFISPTNKENIL
ncbi:MAG: hypothetical protein JNL74_23270 [Fibrobacteres bacterium]|nr:hypothetical protein [Fibrobacterota bacterium]